MRTDLHYSEPSSFFISFWVLGTQSVQLGTKWLSKLVWKIFQVFCPLFYWLCWLRIQFTLGLFLESIGTKLFCISIYFSFWTFWFSFFHGSLLMNHGSPWSQRFSTYGAMFSPFLWSRYFGYQWLIFSVDPRQSFTLESLVRAAL